jgi:hypothetical protein
MYQQSNYCRVRCTITTAGAGYCRISWRHPDSFLWQAVKSDLRDCFEAEYEPDRKCWFVYASVGAVRRWARQYFSDAEIDADGNDHHWQQRQQGRTTQTQGDVLAQAFAALHLLPRAPRENWRRPRTVSPRWNTTPIAAATAWRWSR